MVSFGDGLSQYRVVTLWRVHLKSLSEMVSTWCIAGALQFLFKEYFGLGLFYDEADCVNLIADLSG